MSEDFFLSVAFIPSEGYFEDLYNSLRDEVYDAIPLLGDLSEFWETFKETDFDGDYVPPVISFTGGGNGILKDVGELQIINFDFYDDYRETIFDWVRMIAWFMFLRGLFSRIGGIIQGASQATYVDVTTGEISSAKSRGFARGWKD